MLEAGFSQFALVSADTSELNFKAIGN
jgi:hypothetical protein